MLQGILHTVTLIKVWQKRPIVNFSPPLTLLMIVIPSAKNPSKSSNLVIFGPWDIHWHMESCFQRFGWVFKATRGVKTELVPKKSYFCWNHKVKSAISSTAIKHPKTPNFLNVLAIFQTNLVKRMGKALVPAVPRLFSHLGHPTLGLQSHVLFWVRIMKRRVRTVAMPFLLSVLVLCLPKHCMLVQLLREKIAALSI